VDARKAERILSDSQVQQAIANKRMENPDFLLFQEAFADKDELAMAQKNGFIPFKTIVSVTFQLFVYLIGVDAVFLGEELLLGGEDNKGIVKAIQQWLL